MLSSYNLATVLEQIFGPQSFRSNPDQEIIAVFEQAAVQPINKADESLLNRLLP